MSALWIGSEKLKPNDTIASVINQGTLGIGFIGLAECLVALLGNITANLAKPRSWD